MTYRRQLFERDHDWSKQMTAPEARQALADLLATPNRTPRGEVVRAIRDALAADLAVERGVDFAGAKEALLAGHKGLRTLYARAGMARGLPAIWNVAKPVADRVAGAFQERNPSMMTQQEAGDLLDQKAQELAARHGLDYPAALNLAYGQDAALARAYDGAAEAEKAVANDPGVAFDQACQAIAARDGCTYATAMDRAKVEQPALFRAYAGGDAREAHFSPEPEPQALRRVDASQRIPGKTYVMKLAPVSAGGGLFEVMT